MLQLKQYRHLSFASMVKLIIVVAIIHIFYWKLIEPIIADPPQLDLLDIIQTEVAELPSPTFEIANKTIHKQAELPYFACCMPVYLSVRMTVNLETVPPSGLGVLKSMSADNFMLRVNNTEIIARGKMELASKTYHGQKTELARVPSGLLHKGNNTFHFITVRSGSPYTDIYKPFIGVYEHMRQKAAKRLWIMNEYKQICSAILLLIGIAGVILAVNSSQKLFPLWLTVLSFTWAFHNIFGYIFTWSVSAEMRLFIYFSISYLIPVALFCLIDSWTGKPYKPLQLSALIIWLILIVFAFFNIHFITMPTGFDQPDSLVIWTYLTFTLFCLGRIVWHFIHQRDGRTLEIAIILLCASALVADAWSELFYQRNGGNLIAVTPFFVIALAMAFLNRNFHLFKTADEINKNLSSKLMAREKELQLIHSREQEFTKKQAYHDERQRIMRDMHDGLGSQLMSMLIAAKRGQAKQQWIAEGLQFVIDEMRLLIDSMDSVGDSLNVALSTFRERQTPRLEQAGFELDWQVSPNYSAPDLLPGQALQVFRILQEAVANSTKHSNGDKISIRITNKNEEQNVSGLEITISDNGAGFISPIPGRGIKNMENRAKNINAKFNITSTDQGVVVWLLIAKRDNQEHD